MRIETKDKIRELGLTHKGFCAFIVFQALILCFVFTGFFKKTITINFDAGNMNIRDEKVVVNEDNSFYVTGRNDAEPFGRWIAGTEPFVLKEGVYEIALDYWSLLHDTELGGNCEDITGALQILRTKIIDDKICYNDLTFQDGDTHQKTRLWIRNIGGEEGLQLMVNFHGMGELRIDRIVIQELFMWRVMKFFAWFFGFLTIDAIYIYFFVSRKAENKPVVAILISASFIASLPLLTDSLFCGHDLDFHLNRILALANGLEAGHIFVPIQTEVLNGYGYASPLFYSQLFLYLPAILYNLAVPMQVCYQIYAIFVNILTCAIAYYSFKGIVRDNLIAAVGALLYLLSPYRITNLYIRAAVGEYTAMAFFPLVVYGFVYVYNEDEKRLDYYRNGGDFAIVIGLSGLIESHMLSCELSAMFIVAICLINYKKTFQPRRFIVLVKAAVLTLLINMAFILPFLDSMQMNIRVNNEPVNQIQVHGTYLQQIFSGFQVSLGDSRRGMNNEMPLSLGIALMLGILVFLVYYSIQNKQQTEKSNEIKIGGICTIFTIVSIILSLRFFPWDSLEHLNKLLAKMLCIVQFPWRYLSMATIFATVATIIGLYGMKQLKGVRSMQLLGGGLCLLTILANSMFMSIYTNGINVERVYGDADVIKAVSGGEYILDNTTEGNLRWRKIFTDENFVTVSNYQYEGGVTTFDCRNISETEMSVEIPLLNYDNYYARDMESGSALRIANGTDNRVRIAVPAQFEGTIRVTYEFPILWKIAYIISAVSVLSIIVAILRYNRKKSTCTVGRSKEHPI